VGSIVGVDVGGTFTDVFVYDVDGATRSAKAPSTPDVIDGVLAALVQVVEPSAVTTLSLGSTIATNALVERRLARVGLLTTKGFRDTLDIRRLWRPMLFGHGWNRPVALVPRQMRLEAAGRIDWRGRELESLAEDEVHAAARHFAACDVEAVAVAFLFSYLNASHERRAAEILSQQLDEVPILLSSEVNPERSEYERTSTTVIAAGLAPVVDRALSAVETRLTDAGLACSPRVMKSNGGVMSMSAARKRPVELVKSGPAGGAAAGVFLASRLGTPNLILIDIGGTTADASLIVDGQAARADQDSIEWDIPVRVPVVDIRSIGSGGGSIAHIDQAGAMRVGPRSAGARPGPVCYGQGGTEPTVTDAALVAGWIDPHYFLGGAIKLDAAAAKEALSPIAEVLNYSVRRAAAAVLHMATVEMATLIRKITVERGLDPRSFTLVAFGGAGPLFIGTLLEELEIDEGIVPREAATLSAMGGAFADVVFDYRRSELALVTDVEPRKLHRLFDQLIETARADLSAEGVTDPTVSTSVDLRYAGQWHEIETPIDTEGDLQTAAGWFEKAHEELWGHRRKEDPIELTGLRVRAIARSPKPPTPSAPQRRTHVAKGWRHVCSFPGTEGNAAIFERDDLSREFSVSGPVIVEEPTTTTVVLDSQRVGVNAHGDLVVRR
jgi:N-methylhydantoinase A